MKKTITYHPKTKDELKQIIEERIKEKGNQCNLNDIDVSNVTNMSMLFYESPFNGDISQWDMSNVQDMSGMFINSPFNGNISQWNVSNVKNMKSMFYGSKFNGDISQWNVSSVQNMSFMFLNCPLEINPPAWYKNKQNK